MNEVRCPICDTPLPGPNPAGTPDFPFCGRRCRLVDLGRWLGGRYRIGSEAEEEATVEPDIEQDSP